MRSATEQRKFDLALTELFERTITFNEVLGLKVILASADETKTCFEMKPQLVGHYHYGRLHGGVISAVLDTSAGLAIMAALGAKHAAESSSQVAERFLRLGTIDLRVDYLRQGTGTTFISTSKVTRLGSRIASTQMALHNESGILIATGAGTYIVS